MSARLWEVEHPYYCNEGNYALAGMHNTHGSWAAFIDELGDADEDMNLVFRWDWKDPDPDDCVGESEDGRQCPAPCDGTCGRTMDSRLLIFYMGQRKAKCWSVEVTVAREQEPEIRAWLEKKWAHMQRLWSPFAPSPVGQGGEGAR